MHFGETSVNNAWAYSPSFKKNRRLRDLFCGITENLAHVLSSLIEFSGYIKAIAVLRRYGQLVEKR